MKEDENKPLVIEGGQVMLIDLLDNFFRTDLTQEEKTKKIDKYLSQTKSFDILKQKHDNEIVKPLQDSSMSSEKSSALIYYMILYFSTDKLNIIKLQPYFQDLKKLAALEKYANYPSEEWKKLKIFINENLGKFQEEEKAIKFLLIKEENKSRYKNIIEEIINSPNRKESHKVINKFTESNEFINLNKFFKLQYQQEKIDPTLLICHALTTDNIQELYKFKDQIQSITKLKNPPDNLKISEDKWAELKLSLKAMLSANEFSQKADKPKIGKKTAEIYKKIIKISPLPKATKKNLATKVIMNSNAFMSSGLGTNSSVERRPGKIKYGFNLSGANLEYSNLSEVCLLGIKLNKANLSFADMNNSNLSDSDLSGASLKNANLSNVNLEGSNLSGADLSGADLSGANLKNVDLTNVRLDGMKIRITDLAGAIYDKKQLEKMILVDEAGKALPAWQKAKKDARDSENDNKVVLGTNKNSSKSAEDAMPNIAKQSTENLSRKEQHRPSVSTTFMDNLCEIGKNNKENTLSL